MVTKFASRHLSRHLNQLYNHNIVSRHLRRHIQQPYGLLYLPVMDKAKNEDSVIYLCSPPL